MRYSPQPIEYYSRNLLDLRVGPAQSPFLRDDPLAWNLAWVSHNYDATPQASDPKFTTHVRETARNHELRKHLNKLPEQFYHAVFVLQPRLVRSLPMFAAYGLPWVNTVQQRARWAEPNDPLLDAPIGNTALALQHLTRIFSAPSA